MSINLFSLEESLVRFEHNFQYEYNTRNFKEQFKHNSVSNVFDSINFDDLLPIQENKHTLFEIARNLENIREKELKLVTGSGLYVRSGFAQFFLSKSYISQQIQKSRQSLDNLINRTKEAITRIRTAQMKTLQSSGILEQLVNIQIPNSQSSGIYNALSAVGSIAHSCLQTITKPFTCGKIWKKRKLGSDTIPKNSKISQRACKKKIASPTLPQIPPIKFKNVFHYFYLFIEATLPKRIMDDGHLIYQPFLFTNAERNITNFFETADTNNPKTNLKRSQIKSMITLLFAHFEKRHRTILNETNIEKQEKLKKKFESDLRFSMIKIAVAFEHCVDRIHDDVEFLYFKFAVTDLNMSAEYEKSLTLENSCLKALQGFRRECFNQATVLPIEDRHQAATAQYFKLKLNHKFNLGFLMDETAYPRLAKTEWLGHVEEEYHNLLNVERLLAYFNRIIFNSESKEITFTKVKDWLLNNFDCEEADLVNEDATAFKPEYLFAFLKAHGIIY